MLHLGAALSFVWICVSLTDNPATIRWLKAQCPDGDKSHQKKKKNVASAGGQIWQLTRVKQSDGVHPRIAQTAISQEKKPKQNISELYEHLHVRINGSCDATAKSHSDKKKKITMQEQVYL